MRTFLCVPKCALVCVRVCVCMRACIHVRACVCMGGGAGGRHLCVCKCGLIRWWMGGWRRVGVGCYVQVCFYNEQHAFLIAGDLLFRGR